MVLVEKLDELGKPAWIALAILGFMAWWPLGLASSAFFIGSGRMGCWHHHSGGQWQNHMGRWQSKMERMQEKMDRMRAKMDGAAAAALAGARHRRAATAPSTIIAPRRCSGSKKSSASSRNFWSGCALPRTGRSSISS